jgi:uncharacterized protein (DUF736 family)
MAHIGMFNLISNGFEGELFMLPLTTKGVRVVKIDPPSSNKKAPTHRILVGRAEIGSAWPKTTDDGRDYLSLTIDFPGLVAPVYAILIKDNEDEGYSAYWSRAKKPVFE